MCEEVPMAATSGFGLTSSLFEDCQPCSLPLFLTWSAKKHLPWVDISWSTFPGTQLCLYTWSHKNRSIFFPKTLSIWAHSGWVILSALWLSSYVNGFIRVYYAPVFSQGGIPVFRWKLPFNAFACVWSQWKGIGESKPCLKIISCQLPETGISKPPITSLLTAQQVGFDDFVENSNGCLFGRLLLHNPRWQKVSWINHSVKLFS